MGLHVGDTVRVRDWDDMATEYAVDPEGDIMKANSGWYYRFQDIFCGRDAVVDRIVKEAVHGTFVEFIMLDNGDKSCAYDWALRKVDDAREFDPKGICNFFGFESGVTIND